MKKIDFKKELKHLYKLSAKSAERVTVPGMNFLMIDGQKLNCCGRIFRPE